MEMALARRTERLDPLYHWTLEILVLVHDVIHPLFVHWSRKVGEISHQEV